MLAIIQTAQAQITTTENPQKGLIPIVSFLLLNDSSINECSSDFTDLTEGDCIQIDTEINLDGRVIDLPANVSVKFVNGRLSNGTLNFNGGRIDGELLNTFLTITGNVQLSSPSVDFVTSRWDIVEGLVSDLRATQNTEGMNEAIQNVHALGGSELKIGALDAYFYGRGGLNERYIYYDVESALENAILIPSDFHFMMSDATTLRVQPSNNPADRLLAIVNEDNSTISGGRLIGDRLEHDYACAEDVTGLRRTTHEYGSLINLQGAHNALIDSVFMDQSTGDGISALGTGLRTNSGELQGENRENFEVTIRDTVITRSRRNNISLTDGRTFTIVGNTFSDAGHGEQEIEQQYKRALALGETTDNPVGGKGCAFELDENGQKIPLYTSGGIISENGSTPYRFPIPNTSGTLPRAGIDLESFRGRDRDNGTLLQYERISDVHLTNNDFVGNTFDLILFSTDHVYIDANRFGDGIQASSAASHIWIRNNTFVRGDEFTNPFRIVNRAIFIASIVRNVNGVDVQLMHDFEISGNNISGYSAGMVLSGKNINVHHNYIKDALSGISLRETGEDIHLYDNTIYSRERVLNDMGQTTATSTGYKFTIANMNNVVIENIDYNDLSNPQYFSDGVEKGSTDTGFRPISIDRFNSDSSAGGEPQLTIDKAILKSTATPGQIWASNSQGVVIKNSRIGNNIENNISASSTVTFENNTSLD